MAVSTLRIRLNPSGRLLLRSKLNYMRAYLCPLLLLCLMLFICLRVMIYLFFFFGNFVMQYLWYLLFSEGSFVIPLVPYFVDKSLLNFHSLHELVLFNEIYWGISYHFGSYLWSTNNDKDTDIGAHQIQKIVGHGHDIYMYINLRI